MPTIERHIESILGDEGLTDGLTDTVAQEVIDFCIKRIEALGNLSEAQLDEQVHTLKTAIRKINKSAEARERGKTDRIPRYLGAVWPADDLPRLKKNVENCSQTEDVIRFLLTEYHQLMEKSA